MSTQPEPNRTQASGDELVGELRDLIAELDIPGECPRCKPGVCECPPEEQTAEVRLTAELAEARAEVTRLTAERDRHRDSSLLCATERDQLVLRAQRAEAERDHLLAALTPNLTADEETQIRADVQATHELKTAVSDAASVLGLRGWPDLAQRLRTAWQAYTHDDPDTVIP